MIRTNDILNELKKSVFGQDEYLKQLAITGYKHQLKNKLIENNKYPINSNLLVIGPSGCGKTFSVKLLSKLLDVPFYEVNCSNLVQVGYKGAQDIEKALGDMVNQFGSKSQNAIVYLDEFDKILDLYMLKEGRGKGSQQNFLKIMEPNTIPVNKDSGRSSLTIPFDTSGLTFIATGSFEEIKEKVRVNNIGKMGFNSKETKDSTILNKEDLIKYGYMPELIGRFSKIININQLSKEDFYNIIKNGDRSSLKSYELLLKEQNIGINIDDEVYKTIADKAYNTSTGARNIENILNEILDSCLSDISNDETISEMNIKYENDSFIAKYKYDKNRKNTFQKVSKTVNSYRVYLDILDALKAMNLEKKVLTEVKGHFSNILLGDKEMESSFFKKLLEDNKETSIKELEDAKNNLEDHDELDIQKLSIQVEIYDFLINKYFDKNEQVKEAH